MHFACCILYMTILHYFTHLCFNQGEGTREGLLLGGISGLLGTVGSGKIEEVKESGVLVLDARECRSSCFPVILRNGRVNCILDKFRDALEDVRSIVCRIAAVDPRPNAAEGGCEGPDVRYGRHQVEGELACRLDGIGGSAKGFIADLVLRGGLCDSMNQIMRGRVQKIMTATQCAGKRWKRCWRGGAGIRM